ncbi:MAG: glycosyltransferase, partial [Calditrichaeota bacterium]
FITNGLQTKKFQRLHAQETITIRNVPDRSTGEFKKPQNVNAPIIGRVGYIKPGIGLESLLEAAASLRENFPDLKVVLVGKVFEPYQPTFNALLKKFAALVEYRGFFPYPEVLQNYRDFSISYMAYELTPEFRYISPTKLFESMAFGVPVIVSPVGDAREILQKYPCGIMIQNITATEIAVAIEKILANPELQKQFRLTGRRAFEQEFNWQLMQKKLVAFYQHAE